MKEQYYAVYRDERQHPIAVLRHSCLGVLEKISDLTQITFTTKPISPDQAREIDKELSSKHSFSRKKYE